MRCRVVGVGELVETVETVYVWATSGTLGMRYLSRHVGALLLVCEICSIKPAGAQALNVPNNLQGYLEYVYGWNGSGWAKYDPVHYTCAAATTLQLRDGYNVYDIDGGGSIGTCTIVLPAHPADSQFVRIAFSTSFTLLTLVIQSTPGTTADGGTIGVITGPVTPQWQMQNGTFRKIGS